MAGANVLFDLRQGLVQGRRMKTIIMETEGEGLTKLMGRKVLLLCANYFYAGVLSGVDAEQVKLTDPSIVYETGEWSAVAWKDSQNMGIAELFVRLSAVEAYGEAK
jgi:hypothetical protein